MSDKFPPGSLVRFKRPYKMDYCHPKTFFPKQVFQVVRGLSPHQRNTKDTTLVNLAEVWFVLGDDRKIGEEYRDFDDHLFEIAEDIEPED